MKIFFIVIAVLGAALFGWAFFQWAALGFPVDFDSFQGLTGNKPLQLNKDNPLFFVGLGAIVLLYALFELIRRRDNK